MDIHGFIPGPRPTTCFALDESRCELCAEPIPQEDVNVEAFEVSGLLICTDCLEASL